MIYDMTSAFMPDDERMVIANGIASAINENLKIKKMKCNGLKCFMKYHELPRDELSMRDSNNPIKMRQLDKLLSVSKEIDTLKNWVSCRTPVKGENFEKLIKVLEDLTNIEIDPKSISSEYETVHDVISKFLGENYDVDMMPYMVDVVNFNLSIMKATIIKEKFFRTNLDDVCKWILYLEVLREFDLRLLSIVSIILCMNEDGKSKAKKLIPESIDFDGYISSIEDSDIFIKLKNKIKNDRIKEEIAVYLIKDIEPRIGISLPPYENDIILAENINKIYEELWSDFTGRIDLLYDGLDLQIEYKYFYFKMIVFLSLFKKENFYIFDWIINYYRIDDKDRFLEILKYISKKQILE